MHPALVLMVSEDGQSYAWQPVPGAKLPPFTAAAACVHLQGLVQAGLLGGGQQAKPIIVGSDLDAKTLEMLKRRNGLAP